MAHHVDNICPSRFCQLRHLRAIRSSLKADCLVTLLHAFISSRLDYCCSLLYGVSNAQSKRLQSVQNAVACLVSGSRKFDHVSPVLCSLHWLPVLRRITYKLAMLVNKCLNSLMPIVSGRALHPGWNAVWSLPSLLGLFRTTACAARKHNHWKA